MKIGIIGNGKMGQEIRGLAVDQNHDVTLIIDLDNQNDLIPDNLKKADVVFEFTTPEAAPESIKACIDSGIPVVSGTTGWLDHYAEIAEYCRQKNQAMFYSSNYSLGVNILFNLNRSLAKIMNAFPEYRIKIEETHHIRKVDAPSGTAITMANDIVPILDHKNQWEMAGENKKNAIPIHSVRESATPGIHTVSYESEFDLLEIRHSAKNRKGFALGALMAGEFLLGKQGVFGMQDLISL